eukprot:5646168-Amphidinium_carterae.1
MIRHWREAMSLTRNYLARTMEKEQQQRREQLKFAKWEYMSFQYRGKDLTFIDGDEVLIGQQLFQEGITDQCGYEFRSARGSGWPAKQSVRRGSTSLYLDSRKTVTSNTLPLLRLEANLVPSDAFVGTGLCGIGLRV